MTIKIDTEETNHVAIVRLQDYAIELTKIADASGYGDSIDWDRISDIGRELIEGAALNMGFTMFNEGEFPTIDTP